MAFSQAKRLIRVKTNVPDDKLVCTEISGEEGINQLFSYQLTLRSEELALTAKDLVGQTISIEIYYAGEKDPRVIHGYISHLSLGPLVADKVRAYRISVHPGFWFAQYGNKNRIFQNLSNVEIVEQVLKDYSSVIKFSKTLKSSYATNEYVVQYNESDLDFIHRLLAEDGISYYFKHSNTKHELCLVDDNSGYDDLKPKEIEFTGDEGKYDSASVKSWLRSFAFHEQKVDFLDYLPETPGNTYKQSIKTNNSFGLSANTCTQAKFSQFSFQEDGDKKQKFTTNLNKSRAESYLQAAEMSYETASGHSDVMAMNAGLKFTLDHALESEKGDYLLTQVHLHATDSNDGPTSFENQFNCINAKTPVRPPMHNTKNHVPGPQVAKVIELASSESDGAADKKRMVKVVFPWAGDENACWVRVVQAYAGKSWGASFVPRLGQEVLVEFVGGDIDRPVIVGALYNGDNNGPAYTSTQSGFKTAATKFNELRFDDKKDKEEFYMEAGKDMVSMVHNDQTHTVENNQTVLVKVDAKETVEGNKTQAVKGDHKYDLDGNQTNTIKGDETTKINGNQDVKISGNQSDKVTGKYDLKVTGATTIKGTGAIKMQGQQKITIQANMGIDLKVGGSKISITPAGITIKAPMVTVDGSGMTTVKGGGMLTLKGGITMIN